MTWGPCLALRRNCEFADSLTSLTRCLGEAQGYSKAPIQPLEEEH